MNIFLDANILVSVFNHEMPTFSYSARVMILPTFRSYFKLFTSPTCLAIAYYFAEKKCGNENAIEKIKILSNQIQITSIGPGEVYVVNINNKINDYEDGPQYYAALNAKCNMIITENIGDFFFSEIPVYTLKDYILNVL